MTLWTVYEHPKTVGLYVAWRSAVGDVEQDEHLILSSDLDAIRARLKSQGLTCQGRDPQDQPCIVEVWL